MSEITRYGKVGGGSSGSPIKVGGISTETIIENNPTHDIRVYNGFTGV